MKKIGFGGGCHWCTEAIFQSLKGVLKVDQGWISSTNDATEYSEAVIVHFNEAIIGLASLVSIHLHTHSSTSNHPLRSKYRSAIYSFSQKQASSAQDIMLSLQKDFDAPIITKVLPFASFKRNKEQYLEYYLKNPEKQFCKTYIQPKLAFLMKNYSKYLSN